MTTKSHPCYVWREERLQLYDPVAGEWLGNVLEQRDGQLAERNRRLAAEAEIDRRQAMLRQLRGE